MRYLRAKFTNYIGFYNGMGLNIVDIDFTKCTHNIILIVGENASGKSTLLNHLNPFPDGSTSFIPNKTAEKDLVLFHQGDTYEIQIISPADLKGRKTTKAFIRKNGTELNENGNVTSYKDIIFSEFEMDSNYISLSRLSSVDRGIGDKTPAERKRFVSGIIDDLEIYNSMYKTLNKKALIYKSHVNTLHTKIQNIGNKEALEYRLNMLKDNEQKLRNLIQDANNAIVEKQVKNSISEEEAIAIKDLTDKSSEISRVMHDISTSLDIFYNKTKIKRENIQEKFETDQNLFNTYTSKLDEITRIWEEKSKRLAEVNNNILTLEAEIGAFDEQDNITDRYNASNNTINSYKKALDKLGFPDKEEMLEIAPSLISFCERLCLLIDNFYDNIYSNDIEFIINHNLQQEIQIAINNQNNLLDNISKLNDDISKYQSELEVLATLENRPSKCNIDSCPIIADAIKMKKSIKGDPVDKLSKIQHDISILSAKCTKEQENIDHMNSLAPKAMKLDMIRNMVSENINNISIFWKDLNIDNMLINNNTFNIFRDPKFLIDGLNIYKSLVAERNSNAVLEAEYKGFREKIQLLNSSKAMIAKLKEEQTTLNEEIKNLKSNIDNYTSLVKSTKINIDNETIYYNNYILYLDKENEFSNIQLELNKFSEKSAKAIESLSEINEIKSNIEKYNADLNPIIKEISSISGQLTMLESYYQEYNTYKASFDTIETLKKYCNPTGGGIQTLFMQLYMSKTVSVSNQILSMLFNGAYQLLDFVINESEFRIPFIGEGLPVDDISSGSNSQISMMSMIINLVLLHQGSSKFNIAQLDEIDGSLSHSNRAQFVNILFQCMGILEIEQMFLISHSIEVDNTFADIIKLKNTNSDSGIASGNIIWDYDEIIKDQNPF